jgi:hypothetical protein
MGSSVMLNPEGAKELGLVVGNRVRVTTGKQVIKDVHIVFELLNRGELVSDDYFIFSNRALMATMIVLMLINAAPMAGVRTMP